MTDAGHRDKPSTPLILLQTPQLAQGHALEGGKRTT